MQAPDVRSLARRGWLPALVFVACAFAFLPLALLGQRTYVAVDMLENTSPYREALTRPPSVVSVIQTDQAETTPGPVAFFRALRHGVFQRWDPNLAGGTPTGVLPLNGLYSPFSVGWLVLPAWYAISLKVFLALVCSQAFTYLLLRRLGAGAGPSVLAGVAYTFTGTNLVLIHRVDVAFLAPAMFWATHRVVSRPSRGNVALLAATVAAGWLQGFPSGWVYCVYAISAWGAWLAARGSGRLVAAARRAVPVAAGVVWGVALAAVTMVPLVSEVLARGTLQARSSPGPAGHIPSIQLFGLFDLSAIGPPVGGPWWSGLNPVESISHVGMIVTVAVAAALLAAVLGRLRVSREGADAWPFFCGMAVVGVVVVFVGTPLLEVVARLPGIARNPIGRSRFLIGLATAVLGGLALDGWWRSRPERVTPSRLASAATLAIVGLSALVYLPDFARAASDASELRHVAAGFTKGAVLAAAALAIAGVARRRGGRAPVVATLVLAAMLFAQLGWPVRHFTPEAPRRDFYPTLAAHRELAGLLGGRYRFTAADQTFYPNAGQVQRLPDLRGQALHSREFKAMVNAVNPAAFALDPLKIFLDRDQWNLASPVLDDLAVRYLALSTTDVPYGHPVNPDLDWDRWVAADALSGEQLAGVAPGPVNGLFLPLDANGDCTGARVRVAVRSGGREVAATTRPAYDVGGYWTAFALLAQSLRAGDAYRLDLSTTAPGCRLAVGVNGSEVARQLLVEDPADPVRLVSTTQAWIYERPSAHELVSAHRRWRAFPDQASLLAWAAQRGAAEADVAGFVGPSPPGLSPATGVEPPPAVDYRIGDNSVRVRTSGAGPALVVLSENRADGWTARVDGRAAPIVAVDGGLMGVFVPAGDHTVALGYLPRSFVAGGLVTLAALVGLAVAVAPAGRRAGAGVRVG